MVDYEKDIKPNKLSNQKDFLQTAMDRKLLEIERFFVTPIESFLERGKKECRQRCDYFCLNLGETQFWFEPHLNQTFRFYSANAPIIRFPEIYDGWYDNKYQLSQIKNLASERLKKCLGKVCEDVRIWTYSESEFSRRNLEREKERGYFTPEEFEEEIQALEEEIERRGEEITDSGISYLLSNGEEIIYCCNLYDGNLCDRLLFVQDLHQDYIHSCFSLGQDKYIIPPKKFKFSGK
ncbi:MAG TPA: hypothetical protein DCL61_07845 [Cyanobacteria bacterium UBA12227]|nr:hypothetical protein [Cyanobacteria bacterium UBA12227]HAX90502.1 hypothetical protein [Cyanobacteria bacterium UBA11370]HBY80234.1 hypothetical protein [Cyanobacteria bacterium UBA11148]